MMRIDCLCFACAMLALGVFLLVCGATHYADMPSLSIYLGAFDSCTGAFLFGLFLRRGTP
jgi:hypothetical protein